MPWPTCLETRTPEQVIAEISAAGLRGRGGAGFPTARKWAAGRAPSDPVKYVVCNGDEGDPGAFMDRLVLESDPHRVLEGLAIAAYAVGAAEGFLYIRAEYPLAVERIRAAIHHAGSAVFWGACAWRSARARARSCAARKPRSSNRSKASAACPSCVRLTPWNAAFADSPPSSTTSRRWLRCPGSCATAPPPSPRWAPRPARGTKVFALAGKINRGGLIEVPMGITIREVVEEIGGGIRNGRQFKAVQLGGPSGGCIPARLADTPIDYEALAQTGAIMGSGGLVVLDDRDCMVDIARFFLKFTQAESCGKCTFCRIGTKRMLEILERLCAGQGRPGDLEELETLADYVGRASLCGLGQTAPNPVLTTLRYFRGEFEAHLHERRCPAGRCPSLIRYRVTDNCIGCTLCAQACPVGAIAYRPYERHAVDDQLCTRCDMCRQACQDDAIEVI